MSAAVRFELMALMMLVRVGLHPSLRSSKRAARIWALFSPLAYYRATKSFMNWFSMINWMLSEGRFLTPNAFWVGLKSLMWILRPSFSFFSLSIFVKLILVATKFFLSSAADCGAFVMIFGWKADEVSFGVLSEFFCWSAWSFIFCSSLAFYFLIFSSIFCVMAISLRGSISGWFKPQAPKSLIVKKPCSFLSMKWKTFVMSSRERLTF